MTKYFLTVDWCNQGKRGIFCDSNGNAFCQEKKHTWDEMFDVLDAFALVLSPESIPLSEDELKQYHIWYPLGEYSGVYGFAAKD